MRSDLSHLADRVVDEWQAWVHDGALKARVYEAILNDPYRQENFNVEVRDEHGPMGRIERTYVHFIYRDPTNGVYQYLWHRQGRQTADYLKLKGLAKTVWVRLNSVANPPGLPLLQIEAFEGIEPGGPVIAEQQRMIQ